MDGRGEGWKGRGWGKEGKGGGREGKGSGGKGREWACAVLTFPLKPLHHILAMPPLNRCSVAPYSVTVKNKIKNKICLQLG